MSTPLSILLAQTRFDGPTASLEVPEDWLQGRSVFGGLQAAIAAQALRTIVDPAIPLRALQMAFIAPVPQGTVRAPRPPAAQRQERHPCRERAARRP